MKRLLIFLILGPIIGLAVVLAVSLLGGNRPEVYRVIYALPLAYAFGAVPALFTAVVDWSLATKLRFWIRVGVTCCAGYAMTVVTWWLMLLMIIPLPHRRYTSVDLFVFGFVGAIPAAICSWLSGTKK